jgi:protein-tyrosine phosphatase
MTAATMLKRAVKDVWWTWRGRAIANPPLPANPRSLLFVCLGNICRSPFAAAIAARRAQELSMSSRAYASAGLRARTKEPPREAKSAAGRFGVSLDAHEASQMTRELAASHDMIVVMESSHRDTLHAEYPATHGRVYLLSLFDRHATGLDRYNIADPFAAPPAAYEACYCRIDRAVSALLMDLEHGRQAAGRSAS